MSKKIKKKKKKKKKTSQPSIYRKDEQNPEMNIESLQILTLWLFWCSSLPSMVTHRSDFLQSLPNFHDQNTLFFFIIIIIIIIIIWFDKEASIWLRTQKSGKPNKKKERKKVVHRFLSLWETALSMMPLTHKL